MQKGRPTNIDRLLSSQYFYSLICRKIEQNKIDQEQCKNYLKRPMVRRLKIVNEETLQRLQIELSLLEQLKNDVENPEYFEKVL